MAALVASCATSLPWGRPDGTVAASHAEVRTVNAGYRRTASQVLVRAVDRPTRANLDWAAYHANFMIADAPPEGDEVPGGRGKVGAPFAGTLLPGSLTASIARTSLTQAERQRPLAVAPMVEFLAARAPKLAEGLQEVVAAVRAENWGTQGAPHLPRQTVSEAYLHEKSDASELWVKVEFQPWFQALGRLPDEDADGFPELYGRVRPDLVSAEALAVIRGDYAGRTLGPAEVTAWANQLSSYWYPSYNTDLIPVGARWPDDETEAAIRKELGGASFTNPAVIMRGKPQGQPTYNVFLVSGVGSTPSAKTSAPAPALPTGKPSPRPAGAVADIERELTAHGGSWQAWAARSKPYQEVVRQRLRATPAKIKALPGTDGFLFYRSALESTVGGDLEKQAPGKNPLPVIVEFKRMLEARGVDFLFVPVPSKIEIFPDKLDPRLQPLAGQVVNPHVRKLAMALGRAGVEVLDLLQPLLRQRAQAQAKGEEADPIYQRQDTHWSHGGLAIAAGVVAARVKQYPWYAALSARGRVYQTRPVPFARHGDLHSRLAEGLKKRYRPEALVGQQVLAPDGVPYEDDPDSPVVVLGDSFTGVYQLTDCQHAGVSAHLARELGHPVDLVMSYGGGPNVRQKLLRRGSADLGRKRLVIWMMTARDLHNYWENWEPLREAAK